MGDDRSGEVGVEDMAGFEEEGVSLVGEDWRGERKSELDCLRMAVLSYEGYYGGDSVKVWSDGVETPHALWLVGNIDGLLRACRSGGLERERKMIGFFSEIRNLKA